jgi:FkbM family methyltransferase
VRLRDRMSAGSRFRYLLWRATGSGHAVSVRLSSGEKLILRPPPASDLDTAYEVFVSEPYASPRPIDCNAVRRIVDLGANVGYSVLYLARCFPAAQLDAFEPHPEHLQCLRANIEANLLAQRVRVWPQAAGREAAVVNLRDAGNRSQVQEGSGIPVQKADFLQWAAGQRIDLLKLDIEGDEYEIVCDPRFAALDIGALVMEWHSPPGDEKLLAARLQSVGYDVAATAEGGFGGMRMGIFWAFRDRRLLSSL